jgi:hypothetical protein
MRSFVLGMAALALGCVAPAQLTQGGSTVRTAKGDAPVGCTEVGAVEGADHSPYAGGASERLRVEREQAYVKLRNSAADRGANFVQVTKEGSEDVYEMSTVKQRYVFRGIAYKCPAPSASDRASAE